MLDLWLEARFGENTLEYLVLRALVLSQNGDLLIAGAQLVFPGLCLVSVPADSRMICVVLPVQYIQLIADMLTRQRSFCSA